MTRSPRGRFRPPRRDGSAAETCAWLGTATWAGYALGTLVSRQLEHHAGTRAIAVAAALAATSATLLSARVKQQQSASGGRVPAVQQPEVLGGGDVLGARMQVLSARRAES